MSKQLTVIPSASSSEFTLVASDNYLKSFLVRTTVGTLTPREFCRLIFGLDSFNESDIQELEQTSEYVNKARLLICQVLGVRWSHVRGWGRNFQKKIPDYYQRTLWLYWQLYKKEKKEKKQENDELLVS